MKYELIQFEAAADEFKKSIAKQQVDLQKYALQKDVNPKAIEIRENKLNEMYLFLTTAENTVLNQVEELSTEFSKGYRAGEKKGQVNQKSLPKEHLRNVSKERAQKQWANLY